MKHAILVIAVVAAGLACAKDHLCRDNTVLVNLDFAGSHDWIDGAAMKYCLDDASAVDLKPIERPQGVDQGGLELVVKDYASHKRLTLQYAPLKAGTRVGPWQETVVGIEPVCTTADLVVAIVLGIDGGLGDALGPLDDGALAFDVLFDSAVVEASADHVALVEATAAVDSAAQPDAPAASGGEVPVDSPFVVDAPLDLVEESAFTPDGPFPLSGTGGAISTGGTPGTGGARDAGDATGTGGITSTGGATNADGGTENCGVRDCTSPLDNDCNGVSDQQEPACMACKPGSVLTCAAGALGICSAGTQTCQLAADHQSVAWGGCVPNQTKGTRDCTLAKDNDCNGIVDSQEAPCLTCPKVGNTQICSTGASGICAAGTQTCQLAADHQSVAWGECTQSLAKGMRDCTSSNDNDCNGQADNTESTFCKCPVGGPPQSCPTGLSGICAAGTETCIASSDKATTAWGTCIQSKAKGTETCANPGTDDDCDGTVDNIPVTSCNVGTGVGACANGGTTTGCDGTAPICTPAVSGLGDATIWHTSAAPNGSWDWDCDGVVTPEYSNSVPPKPACSALSQADCQGHQSPSWVEANCGQYGNEFYWVCSWNAGPSGPCDANDTFVGTKLQACR
jgi:hypothetical protein